MEILKIKVKKIRPIFIFIVRRRYWADCYVFDVLNSPDHVLSNFDTFLR